MSERLGTAWSEFIFDVPGQQLVDAADGVIGDVGEHVAQVCLGVNPVELCCADEGVEVGSAHATTVGAGEKEIFPLMRSFA